MKKGIFGQYRKELSDEYAKNAFFQLLHKIHHLFEQYKDSNHQVVSLVLEIGVRNKQIFC